MGYAKFIPLLALVFALSSCYHAKITTDKNPSAKVIEESWHSGFLFGLVYPNDIDASECENGVAQVDTQLSFVNMLVGQITFGLYTPMNIKVTCAAGSSMSSVKIDNEASLSISKEANQTKVAQTIQKAAYKSQELNKPVYIQFD